MGDEFSPREGQGVFIRSIGCTRRVFLLDPHLSQPEMEGLAYRIRTLSKNEAINSILIATDDNEGAMPSCVIDLDYPYARNDSADPMLPPEPGMTWHVSGGYDPLAVGQDPALIQPLLDSLADLTLAIRGDSRSTKIPTIVVPHGAITDGGACFLMGSHVMATYESSFRITTPSKGLSLDPVGLSYTLPRLGQEFRQPAAQYPVGMILGLTGYEADASDMMETGLATNYMETPTTLGTLELTLSELPPWNQQNLLKNPPRFHGQPPSSVDNNAAFRNVAVADAVHCFSEYRADGAEMWSNTEAEGIDDPSLDFDFFPWHETRSSALVNYAATFADIFNESSLQGIVERLNEVADKETTDEEEQEGIDVARELRRRLYAQSPFALAVTHSLLKLGARPNETLESCMNREKAVQAKLFARKDFRQWAKHARQSHKGKQAEVFLGWEHKAIAEVSKDEVDEVLGA